MTDNQPKRKLIFLWNYLEWGGAQIYFLGIMKLAKADWDIVVVLPEGSDPKLLGFLDAVGVRYEFLSDKFDSAPATTISRKLQRRLNMLRCDMTVFRHLLKYDLKDAILHIEASPWQSPTLLTALSLLRRANLFVTFHNALPPASRLREFTWKIKIGIVSSLPRFRVFASNKDTKEKFRRWVSDEFFRSIKVTYTTVNPPEIDAVRGSIDKNAIRRKLGIPEGNFVVLCLGQFIDRKGRWIFLEAARTVIERHSDVRFVWITSSELDQKDLEKIESFGLGGNVQLIDAAKVGSERKDILAAYCCADVYALPSSVEGLPVALLEAMAMGVASISTNVYAIPEAIKHELTGLLIEPGDAEALANAIERLYSQSEFRYQLAADGREFAIANFDERAASQIAIDAYREAVANG